MTPMNHRPSHILFCDLSAGVCRREPLDPGLARQAPGGRALAAALLAARPRAAWDAPEAAVVLAPGALAGFDLPGVSFAALTGTNPHTGGILSVAVPGCLGRALARLHLAAVVVVGRAAVPTALFLDADGARLLPLGPAAGQGTVTALAALPA
ncbi:MAG TPA: aldehyde ferredoxin oxidoreductase N-terminal domain-containing protein, partial [Solidesulfovibrio magneticus]|nr:aldehyde ferredoxin oxidoreductase N-terminal domain-containing protein [Solidesulfovibrio magneticus]